MDTGYPIVPLVSRRVNVFSDLKTFYLIF